MPTYPHQPPDGPDHPAPPPPSDVLDARVANAEPRTDPASSGRGGDRPPPRDPPADGGDGRGGLPLPRGPWTDRVVFGRDSSGLPFTYRPHEVITAGGSETHDLAVDLANALQPEGTSPVERIGTIGPFSRLTGVYDPLGLIEELRLVGIVAQPNHVLFTHPGYPNPGYPNPGYPNPGYPNPGYPNPGYPNPGYPNPGYPNPGYPYQGYSNGDPIDGTGYSGPKRSSATPAPEDLDLSGLHDRIRRPRAPGSPHVIVVDTGLARPAYLPDALTGGAIHAATVADTDEPDEDGDEYLDPVAGHGTFIAGVIAQIAPGCEITLHKVFTTFGDSDEWTIIDCLDDLLPLTEPTRTIVNLSFGGYVYDHPHALSWAVRRLHEAGALVVASAGNDATERPQFPAATTGVIGVGAVCPYGAAPFTNYGPWVTASAPGLYVLSTFFTHFDGEAEPDAAGFDPDDFDGWAIWSGTSFACPAVVGNVARIMMTDDVSAHDAACRLLQPPLLRYPNLGAVVNFL